MTSLHLLSLTCVRGTLCARLQVCRATVPCSRLPEAFDGLPRHSLALLGLEFLPLLLSPR